MSFSKLKRLCFVLLSAMLAACHFFSFSAFALEAPAENALPTGYQAGIGSTTYSVNGNTGNFISTGGATTGSWESFNIGSAATFNAFIDGVHLSRVRSEDPSQIFGRMNIEGGPLFLINPGGYLFGPGAQVNASALLASALNITDENFMAGNYLFHAQDSGSGFVSNQGSLNATDGGYIALIGKAVENKGQIAAPNGSAVLAAGESVSLSLDPQGLISAVINESIDAPVYDLNGEQVRDVVANFGTIQANGGQVILSARAADQIFDSVINHSGVIEARGTEIRNGRVVLTGERVGLFGDSRIDVSGESGGGEVLIGGDYQGQNPDVFNAKQTYISLGSVVDASARTNGNGGRIIVFAEESTRILGALSARGGSVSGDGGFVETSGKLGFEIYKTPDISALQGLAGAWLIDPRDVEIVAGAGNVNINAASPFSPTADTAQLGVDLILAAFTGGATVVINTGAAGAQNGNITVATMIDFNGKGTNTLTLNAANDILINAAITDSVPGLDTLNINFANDSDVSGAGNTAITAVINTKGGNFSSTGFTFSNAAGAITTGAGTVTLNHTNVITLGSIESTAAVSVTSTGGAINDNTADNAMDLKGSTLTIAAATGIGAGGSIDVDFTTITSATSTTGGIQLNLMDHDADNQNTTVTLADATTSGDITFTSTSGSGAKTFTSVDTNNGHATLSAAQGNIVLGTVISDSGIAGANDVAVTATAGSVTINNSVTSDDQVSITSNTTIEDNASDDVADILATGLTLSAQTGIGVASSLDVDVTAIPSAASVSGGIALNLLDANNSGVTVTSADASTSGDITLTATSGTGLKTYTLVDTNDGNVNISAASGNIVLTNVNSDTGVAGAHDITVTASAGNVTVNTVNSDDDVTITASNTISDDNNDGTRIAGDRVALSAATGIGAAAATATIDTQAATIFAENSGVGDIYIEELNGLTLENVTAQDGSVSVKTLNAGNMTLGNGNAPIVAALGNNHEATLDVIAGNIVDGNGAGEDVEAHSVVFVVAAGNVGTALDPIEVRSDTTDVAGVTGNSHITQLVDEAPLSNEDIIEEELTKSLFNESSDLSDEGESSGDEEEDEESGEAFTPQSVAEGSDAVDESAATPAEIPVTAETFQACQ